MQWWDFIIAWMYKYKVFFTKMNELVCSSAHWIEVKANIQVCDAVSVSGRFLSWFKIVPIHIRILHVLLFYRKKFLMKWAKKSKKKCGQSIFDGSAALINECDFSRQSSCVQFFSLLIHFSKNIFYIYEI
jgi:hypothetical protein